MRRPCLSCGTPTDGTRCPPCRRAKDRLRPPPSQRGHGPAFYALKPIILERDGYVCQLRRPGCKGYATTVDYVVPWSKGGPTNESNLVAACLSCNSGKRDRLPDPR